MKTSQIKVGQYYIHPQYPGTIYLGCGDCHNRNTTGQHFTRKGLIIVEAIDHGYIGCLVQLKSPKKAGLNLSDFREIKKP